MSTKVLGLVWPLQMPPMCKSVLVSLAYQANDEGVCWPAVSSLEARTCMSPRTVQRALRWLQAHKAIRRELRAGHSTVYIVMPTEYREEQEQRHETPGSVTPPSQRPPVTVTPTPVTVTPPPPSLCHPHPRHSDTTAPVTVTPPNGSALWIEPSVEPSFEPSFEPSTNRQGTGEAAHADLFATGSSKADPEKPHRASRSGCRLDDNWVLPKTWGEWARAERPKWSDEDVRTVATMFRNYWVAKTGKDAIKRDWKATWQNWVLKEPQVLRINGSARGPPNSIAEHNRAVGERWLAKHGTINGQATRVSDD